MTTATRLPPARGPAQNGAASPKKFGRSNGLTRKSHRVLIYGTGGIGKTTLAAAAPAPIFCDLDKGSSDINVNRVEGIESWSDLRTWLQTGDFSDIKSIVIDTMTVAEDLCRRHVIENYKTDKGNSVTSIEGFGWGKGYTHIAEEWKKLFSDLERHYSDGRNIILVCHERVGKVPNPSGDDFIRYEPRLLHNNNASLMHATKEWCDHVLFVNYDVVATEGKAKGSGTRTIYCQEGATHMAKTRRLNGSPIIFEAGSDEVWRLILNNAMAAAVDDAPPEM